MGLITTSKDLGTMSITKMPIKIVQNFFMATKVLVGTCLPPPSPKDLKEVVHLQVAWHANIKCVVNFNGYLQVCKKVHWNLICMSLDVDIHGWPNFSKSSIMVQLPSKRKMWKREEKRVKVRPTNLFGQQSI